MSSKINLNGGDGVACLTDTNLVNGDDWVVGGVDKSPLRVPLNFKRLLDVILDRSVQESEVVAKLISEPHKIRPFVPILKNKSSIYHKVVIYTSSGGIIFDTNKYQVYDSTRQKELDELVSNGNMQLITPKQLADNWYSNKLYDDPHRKLEKQWLNAFLLK